jgi:hypothetical protein
MTFAVPFFGGELIVIPLKLPSATVILIWQGWPLAAVPVVDVDSPLKKVLNPDILQVRSSD